MAAGAFVGITLAVLVLDSIYLALYFGCLARGRRNLCLMLLYHLLWTFGFLGEWGPQRDSLLVVATLNVDKIILYTTGFSGEKLLRRIFFMFLRFFDSMFYLYWPRRGGRSKSNKRTYSLKYYWIFVMRGKIFVVHVPGHWNDWLPLCGATGMQHAFKKGNLYILFNIFHRNCTDLGACIRLYPGSEGAILSQENNWGASSP